MSQTYIFHGKRYKYPIELADDAEAIEDANQSPKIIKVASDNGRVVWERHSQQIYLSLRKVEEKELIQGNKYLIEWGGAYHSGVWGENGRSFDFNYHAWSIDSITAIYELPKP